MDHGLLYRTCNHTCVWLLVNIKQALLAVLFFFSIFVQLIQVDLGSCGSPFTFSVPEEQPLIIFPL